MEHYKNIKEKSEQLVTKVLDTSDDHHNNFGNMGLSLAEALGKEPMISSESSWEEIRDRVVQLDSVRSARKRRIWLRVAASLLILIALSATLLFFVKEQHVNEYAMGSDIESAEMPIINPSGMESQVLADGSRIWFDALSRVNVYGDIAKDSVRQMYAEGDVLFDVAHDPHRPMIVYTSRCVITVLGTKFHLHDYLSEPELILTLYEGSIKVSGENLNYVMKPGQEVRINHQTGQLTLIDHNNDEPKDAPVGYIRGRLKGMDNEQLVVSVVDRQFKGNTLDTIQLKKGKFNLKMQYATARLVSITSIRTPSDNNELPKQATFFYLPGQNIELRGTLDNPQLVGDDFCKQQNEMFDKVYKPSKQQYVELFKRNANNAAKPSSGGRDDYELWLTNHERLAMNFMKAHPDWDISAGLLYDIRTPHLEEALGLLSDQVKTGPMSTLVKVKQQALAHYHQQQRASELTQQGKTAPDFELRDKNGKAYRLSDYRGKYVIIDFWASWCGPCKAGMPKMKNYYRKYSGKLEIIGIATWDVEEGWKRALANLQLPWPNVFSYKGTPTDVAPSYAVKGLPTKFLISPKGEILLRYEGEDNEFYQKIDQLIK